MQFKGTGRLLVKDLDTKQGIVQAYWSAFGNKDDGGDIVQPGCWKKSIAERGPQSKQPRIKFLYQHQETMLLGKPTELVEDGVGLLATSQIVPTALGQDVLLLYEAGVLSEHSVGYETVQSQWDPKQAARLLVECVLWEGSCVTWGMNSETPVVAVKSLTQPERLTEIATKAAKLDSLLHAGNLRSDALCETLERELKALQTALAPTREATSQPYSIQGVLDAMGDLTDRLGRKAASDDDKKAQEARSKKYDIGIKDGGNVTKPSKYANLSDADFADPVNYSYPIDTKAHADNAASRFGDPDNRAVYTKSEQTIIDKRIAAAQKSFGEDDSSDSGKAVVNMGKLIKGSGGDVTVADDGTHKAYTGTHAHNHSTMGSQGGDDMHNHDHVHDADSAHDHSHAEGGKAHGHTHVHKARDFDTIFAQDRNARDLLEDLDDLTDTLEDACTELLLDNGGHSDGEGAATVDTILAQFETRVRAWFANAQQSDTWDDIADQAQSEAEWMATPARYYDYWCSSRRAESRMAKHGGKRSARAKTMPDAPQLLRKDGREISNANRAYITSALDGIAVHMKGITEHHGSLVDLMNKTDPDHTRQDEDNTQGDDDTANGGTNPNKGRQTSTPRRTAAEAGTTHQGIDLSALDADLNALKSRRASHR